MLNLIKYLIFISKQAILASGLGLGLQINLHICGFYEGLADIYLGMIDSLFSIFRYFIVSDLRHIIPINVTMTIGKVLPRTFSYVPRL